MENDQITTVIEDQLNFNIKQEKEDFMEIDNWKDITTEQQPLDLQLNEENFDEDIDYSRSNNEWMKNEPDQNVSFSCIHCDQIFDEQNLLILHASTEHNNIENEKKSKKCKKAKKDDKGKKQFKCSVCDACFSLKKNLYRHADVVHNEKMARTNKPRNPHPSPAVHPKIPCVECGKLMSESWLRGHMIRVSSDIYNDLKIIEEFFI